MSKRRKEEEDLSDVKIAIVIVVLVIGMLTVVTGLVYGVQAVHDRWDAAGQVGPLYQEVADLQFQVRRLTDRQDAVREYLRESDRTGTSTTGCIDLKNNWVSCE